MPPANARFRLRRAWRAFLDGQKFTRQPVSVTRQRLGTLVLFIMVLAFGGYLWSTRDEAIRQRAIEFIEQAAPGGVKVHVARATFGMFQGITLHNVQIYTPFDERLDPTARDSDQRLIFHARTLHLRHSPWLLLTGRLRVDTILAVQPTIFLSQNLSTGLRNWQLLRRETTSSTPATTPNRPGVTIRKAELVVTTIDANGKKEYERQSLDADIRPHPASETGYFIEVRRYSEPVERATVFFDPGERVVANTPFVESKLIRMQLPTAARQLFDDLSLEGEVRLARMLYDVPADQQRDAEIVLRNVKCDVPLWLLSRDSAARRPPNPNRQLQDRLVRMTDASGRFKLRGSGAELDISGLFNGAPCRLHGTIADIDGGLETCGFNVAFTATGLPMPEGDIRQRLVDSDDISWALRRVFYDYDPHGPFDFDLRLSRTAGKPESIEAHGVIRPQGGGISVRWFPFPVDQLEGDIRIDGADVYLENIRGRHGSGYLTANATFDTRYDFARVNLDVRATAVPLDTHLFLAMPDRYQSAWRLFRPQGTAHIHTRMQREPASDEEGRPPWRKVISIELVDAQAALPPYPYPIENLYGHLEVEEDRILIRGLTGTCRGASVRIDGYAIVDERDDPRIELRVEGAGIRLDESFGATLPPEGQTAFVQLRPDGTADVLGSISMHDDGGLVWNLRTKVRDTTVAHDQFPYRLEDVHGEIDLLPGHISILNLAGRRDSTRLSAHGQVRQQGDGYALNLAFDAAEVDLNDPLYRALPVGLKDVWDLIRPSGRIRVRTGLNVVSAGGEETWRHRTDIEPQNAALCFREFPLPLSGVNGHVLVTSRSVEILALTGNSCGGTLELSGHVELGEGGLRGALNVTAKGMTFGSEFLDSLPPSLGRFLKTLRPRGKFDLELAPLRFEEVADGQFRWDFDADLRLDDAHVYLGFNVDEAEGTLSGRCSIDETGRIDIDGSAELDSVIMAGWALENLRARIATTQDGKTQTLEVRDAEGRLYGGDASGFAKVELSGPRPRYEANIAIRDAQLGEYLSWQRRRAIAAKEAKPDEPPSTARGSVDGRINITGRTGRGAYREGTGELFVSRAQVWKLPLALAIFQVVNLAPDENVFHDGRLEFSLLRDTLTFHTIDLQGHAMSFVGAGTLNLATDDMDVTLLAGSPVRIHVPVLTEVLEGASREIMEVRVTGTMSEPRIEPQPLKSLTNALRTLFPEERVRE